MIQNDIITYRWFAGNGWNLQRESKIEEEKINYQATIGSSSKRCSKQWLTVGSMKVGGTCYDGTTERMNDILLCQRSCAYKLTVDNKSNSNSSQQLRTQKKETNINACSKRKKLNNSRETDRSKDDLQLHYRSHSVNRLADTENQ